MESKPAVFAIRAISIERTRRTVIDETTSPRASFSLTLLRTTSLGRSDMTFLPGGYCMLARTGKIRACLDRKDYALRYRNPRRHGVRRRRLAGRARRRRDTRRPDRGGRAGALGRRVTCDRRRRSRRRAGLRRHQDALG